ncbi:hypothetical protein B0H14DRAFT_3864356 [Mycena olivaceomarginata]|nr:hypothetical protein B0H14DRAFT_3864356 [Mycena olivaceomarginata]
MSRSTRTPVCRRIVTRRPLTSTCTPWPSSSAALPPPYATPLAFQRHIAILPSTPSTLPPPPSPFLRTSPHHPARAGACLHPALTLVPSLVLNRFEDQAQYFATPSCSCRALHLYAPTAPRRDFDILGLQLTGQSSLNACFQQRRWVNPPTRSLPPLVQQPRAAHRPLHPSPFLKRRHHIPREHQRRSPRKQTAYAITTPLAPPRDCHGPHRPLPALGTIPPARVTTTPIDAGPTFYATVAHLPQRSPPSATPTPLRACAHTRHDAHGRPTRIDVSVPSRPRRLRRLAHIDRPCSTPIHVPPTRRPCSPSRTIFSHATSDFRGIPPALEVSVFCTPPTRRAGAGVVGGERCVDTEVGAGGEDMQGGAGDQRIEVYGVDVEQSRPGERERGTLRETAHTYDIVRPKGREVRVASASGASPPLVHARTDACGSPRALSYYTGGTSTHSAAQDAQAALAQPRLRPEPTARAARASATRRCRD